MVRASRPQDRLRVSNRIISYPVGWAIRPSMLIGGRDARSHNSSRPQVTNASSPRRARHRRTCRLRHFSCELLRPPVAKRKMPEGALAVPSRLGSRCVPVSRQAAARPSSAVTAFLAPTNDRAARATLGNDAFRRRRPVGRRSGSVAVTVAEAATAYRQAGSLLHNPGPQNAAPAPDLHAMGQ